MRIVESAEDLRAAVTDMRRLNRRIGFVPTMGALHEGHAALMRAARVECDHVIVSIFVNPLQFNDPADLANYPKTAEADELLCATLGVDVVYRPALDDVYPAGFDTRVEPGRLAEPYEGLHRPGHFSGMATVVLKLLNIVLADDAYFGKKDFQQLAIVRRMVADFNHPTRVHGVDTVRDDDGLALSSRNVKLSTEARRSAVRINKALETVALGIGNGQSVTEALATGRAEIARDPAIEVEYFDAADPATLDPTFDSRNGVVILAAARVGGVRLIDNREITPDHRAGA